MLLSNIELVLETFVWEEDMVSYKENDHVEFNWIADAMNNTKLSTLDPDLESGNFYKGLPENNAVKIKVGDFLVQETPAGEINGTVSTIDMIEKETHRVLRVRLKDAEFKGRFNCLARGASGCFSWDMPRNGDVKSSVLQAAETDEKTMKMPKYLLIRKMAGEVYNQLGTDAGVDHLPLLVDCYEAIDQITEKHKVEV